MKLKDIKDRLVATKETVVQFSKQPEAKLIAKAAAKTMAGGAVIGVTAGVVLHSIPVLAFAVGLVGGGAWGYHCGKQLDKQLADVYAKRFAEDPNLKQVMIDAIEKLNKQQDNNIIPVPVFN